MKKSTLITLLIVVLAGAAGTYYYLFKWNERSYAVNELIPSDAVFYLNSGQVNQLNTDSVAKFSWLSNLDYVDSLMLFLSEIPRLQTSDYIISGHYVSKDEIGIIIYFLDEQLTPDQILGKQRTTRNFGDQVIFSSRSGEVLDFGRTKVFSPSSLLIESVCKTIQQKNSLVFKPEKAYINWKKLEPFILKGLLPEENAFGLLGETYLTLGNESKGNLMFSGVGKSADSLDTVKWKEFASVIPMNTAMVSSNPGTVVSKLPAPENKLVKGPFIRILVKEEGNFEEILFTSSLQIKTGEFSRINTARYKNYELTSLWYESPEDTSITTVVKIGKQYILSRSEKTIFNLLLAIDDENVWGKSLYYFDLLSNLSTGASSDIIINPAYLLDQDSIASDFLAFQNIVSGNKSLVSCWINTVQTDKKAVIPKVAVRTQPQQQEGQVAEDFTTLVKAETNIISKPYLMRNHNTGAREFLFQTKNFKLNLYTLSGKKLWSKTIEDSIISDIHQVDRYKNNKLQYAFATRNKIHLVDRLGRDVEGFPIKLKAEAEHFNVFDYENKKNYRLMVASPEGKTTLMNMEGKILGIWKPFEFDAGLMKKMIHFRIGTRDCFLAVSRKGTLHLLKRNGSYYPGFPLGTGMEIKDYALTFSRSFESAMLHVLSDENKYQSYSLSGKPIGKPIEGVFTSFLYNDNFTLNNFISQEKIYNLKNEFIGNLPYSFEELDFWQLYAFDNSKDVILTSKESEKKLDIGNTNGNNILSVRANENPVSLLNLEAKRILKVYYTYENEIRLVSGKY